jgi:sugar fermentation stimulation protein A
MADVELKNGQVVTAHCPNSGSMKACCEPGRPVYLSYHDDPRRKLKYTWELIEMPTSLVGINTMVPNRLVYRTIQKGLIEALNGYEHMRREVKINTHTRLDILLSNGENDRCFIEIKNCTLVSDKVACFPDAVTSRGLKHLQELQSLVAEGFRGVIFFLIQRTDADFFRPADQIDPAYGIELRRSVEAGVEMMVYDVSIDFKMISLNRKIPYQL